MSALGWPLVFGIGFAFALAFPFCLWFIFFFPLVLSAASTPPSPSYPMPSCAHIRSSSVIVSDDQSTYNISAVSQKFQSGPLLYLILLHSLVQPAYFSTLSLPLQTRENKARLLTPPPFSLDLDVVVGQEGRDLLLFGDMALDNKLPSAVDQCSLSLKKQHRLTKQPNTSSSLSVHLETQTLSRILMVCFCFYCTQPLCMLFILSYLSSPLFPLPSPLSSLPLDGCTHE